MLLPDWAPDLGRALMGALYLIAGIRHFFLLPVIVPIAEARGVPQAGTVVRAGSAFEAAMGALLILGFLAPLAAVGLIVFTILASVMYLNFWDMPPGETRANAINALLNNVAIIGGLLLIAVYNP